MDFTPELSAFQGVIISADNVHSFSRLTARGGNEDQIEYVVNNILRFLEQHNYVVQNDVVPEKFYKMRDFAFYIMLNSDLPTLEQLVENNGISSVIWTIPTIPKCLMSEMIWNLCMDKYVHEAIAYCWPPLAVEIASALTDHFKYFSPTESLNRLGLVSKAIYCLICRLNFFTFENNVVSNLTTNALSCLTKCLDYFIEPPNSGKLANMKQDALYQFKGNRLQTMLELIHECLTEFTSLQRLLPDKFPDICFQTFKEGSFQYGIEFVPCNNPNKAILECLDKFNELLLDKCKTLVMDVSVDIFCAWSEYEEDGKSVQQNIGETCFKLRAMLLNIDTISEHPVVTMIQQICRKPVEMRDLVNATDCETIIENIRKCDENHIEWLKALIYKDKLCENVALVNELAGNLNVLSVTEHAAIYKICKKYICEHPESTEHAKSLAVKTFQACDKDTKIELLDELFENNSFTDIMETQGFNEMLNTVFNKLIADHSSDLSDVLTVFLQSPQKVFTKVFSLSAESSQQSEIMLQTMLLLAKYTNNYYGKDTEPCVIRVAETVLEDCFETEVKQQNIINFIHRLKDVEIIPGVKLLLLIIMPKLHKALLDKDVRKIHFQCKLLSESFPLEELMPYRAPMLAMIAQILEVVRWKIVTFVEEGPIALDLALHLQVKIFEMYEDAIPEKEESWLKSKLRNLHPLNCYYYRRLWNPPGSNFVEIVSGTSLRKDMDGSQLVAWLTQVLCSTSQTEWCTIWESLSLFDENQRLNVIHEALMALTAAEAANRKDGSFKCILNCYVNFVYIVRYKYFKEPLDDLQTTLIITKMAASANLIQEENIEQFASLTMPLFSYMVQRKSDYTITISKTLEEKCRNPKFLALVNSIFSNGEV